MAKLLHIFYHKEGTFSLLCQQVQLITVSRKIKYNQPDFFIKDYDQFLSFPTGQALANCFHAI